MSGAIVEKYAKAVMSEFKGKELDELLLDLKTISLAFKEDKFSSLINSPIVDTKDKEHLVMSLFSKKTSQKFENLLKLLSQNKRLNLIPDLFERVSSILRTSKNKFKGVIYSNEDLTKDQISKLESIFSKKFDADISLDFDKGDYSGVKVDLEELGVEISFSMDRLKHDMSDYILKAIW